MSCGRGYECSTTGGGKAEGGCGLHFSSLEAFDKHFKGTKPDGYSPICRGADELRAMGWRQNGWGGWTFRPPMTAAAASAKARSADTSKSRTPRKGGARV